MASASLKPGAAALRTGVLAGVVVSAVMTLPSQNSMLASCCPLYQIARIEDSCGKLQTMDRIQKEGMTAHPSTQSSVATYQSIRISR
jgi:hypothetical protein